ncbi:hypothetical protein CRG98_046068 [Punica granatum]|uniref:Uncharacterized protein n=1 Tax=Punica granatum TaxID=22663 RepID=A0A2I0HP85_PUNGR|nr:hypothetical protein CRG98_046068 [Punica granatum]
MVKEAKIILAEICFGSKQRWEVDKLEKDKQRAEWEYTAVKDVQLDLEGSKAEDGGGLGKSMGVVGRCHRWMQRCKVK